MSIIEAITEIPAEHEKNVFGQFDQHIKKIERTLNVTMILRDGTLKIIGRCRQCFQSQRYCAGPGKALHAGEHH